MNARRVTVTWDEAAAALEARAALCGRWLLLVAHFDDEVLAATRVLTAARRLTLAHATDGLTPNAPCGPSLGEARRRELDAALQVLACTPERMALGLPDGGAVAHLRGFTAALHAVLPRFDVVVTHAFEGGHPDHDACALALDAACRRTADPPLRLEFPIYARDGDGARLLAFPREGPEVRVLRLDADESARKRRALQAFASQRHVVDRFPTDREALRLAPQLDASRPREAASLLWARGDAEAERRWRDAAVLQLQA